MSEITVQDITATGTTATIVTYQSAVATGDTFTNTGAGSRVIIVKNGHTTTLTCTVAREDTCEHGVTHNVVQAIAADEEMQLPVGQTPFNDADGVVTITYNASTAMTVAVVSVPVVG